MQIREAETDHDVGEMAGFPGKYAPPEGRLLLAESDGKVVGGVGLRRYSGTACEMKRLFVRPEGRGTGAGAALVTAVIEAARDASYSEMLLDTLEGMVAARGLYMRAGFQLTENYNDNPTENVVHLRLDLQR